MIRGLNHVTLAVRDLDRALAFYRDAMGLEVARVFEGGAYLSAGDLWLCLSKDTATTPTADYTHVAFDVAEADLPALTARLMAHGARQWKENRSEGGSFYFLDPDGHRLELHAGSLASRLAHMDRVRRQECGA
ncbi:VOC family protein [Pontivivens insulae]|uniref:Glutathione transferase FosA n=1 Tax=Pontivivens insulae TaxID=1639689 RepID=A0A2R8A9I3_9RHOB|nr:VOC family protein [Pontivivens insulae]RED12803.1 catechol 2,3-dioxygenase-like lactoylglutathione lyase family enzyme [Pontivivens insulae]SPF28894.1 Glutathione transferase FosA [Pontivivens insulae]